MGLRPRVPYITVLERLGLTSGLKVCVDAGDSASYTTGQPWLDRSGNGYDFNRGATSASEASDPTFNGSAGGLSTGEYWSFDGADYFRYDTTNETWMNNLHKDNAVFTIVSWLNAPGTGSIGVVGTTGNGTAGRHGIYFGRSGSTGPGAMTLLVNNAQPGGDPPAVNDFSSFILTNECFVACAMNEPTGSLLYCLNGSFESKSVTYSGPSTNDATFTMEIGARGNAEARLPNLSRLYMVAIWEGVALSQAQITSIYNASHSRFTTHRAKRFFTQRF